MTGGGPAVLARVLPGHHAGSTYADLPLPETDDFVELFRMHYPRLVRALVLAGSSTPAAEDVAQEAFARTFRHWRRVRGGTNPSGYVYRTGFRLLRRRGVVPSSPLDDLPSAGSDPADVAAANTDLERALSALPPRRRACAVLCWCLDLSPADAAEALKLAPGTVRKQLELARRDLRAAQSG
jgi:RNA polymerase sigma factor (sigma-70 family)